jgi:Domain of unknown function (DUF3859)
MRVLLSLLLLVATSNAANAQTVKINITEFGIYKAKITKAAPNPSTAGVTRVLDDIELVQATTTVPARLNIHFGFRYKIIGQTGLKVTLKKVTLIPQPGIQNPDTGNTTVQSGYFIDRTVGDTSYTDYAFDNAWEIVTGTWTIELWEGDHKLASQSFDVVAP